MSTSSRPLWAALVFACAARRRRQPHVEGTFGVSIGYKCGMIRLTDEQWERIRSISRKSRFPTVVLDANRSRPVACLKQSCGFSTQARSGTCFRKAIRTIGLCIVAFRVGAAMKCCVAFWQISPTNFERKARSTKRSASSTQLCDGQRRRCRDRPHQAFRRRR
jgi:hypothetical protein